MSIDFIGSLPESLTQELLVGKLLVGGLGVQKTGARYVPPCFKPRCFRPFAKRRFVKRPFAPLRGSVLGKALEAPIPKTSGLVKETCFFSKGKHHL